MSVIIDIIPHFTTLFSNPYLFSVLGLIAFAFIVYAIKILTK